MIVPCARCGVERHVHIVVDGQPFCEFCYGRPNKISEEVVEMEVIKRVTDYNGVQLQSFDVNTIATGVACIGDKRFVLRGRPQVALRTGKLEQHGEEVQFKVYANKKYKFKEEPRNTSVWNTVEVVMSKDEARELLKSMVELLEGGEEK